MVQISWPETAVLLVLLAASIYGFWLRFGRVWRIILASKKDPEFHLQPVGPRVNAFIGEVLLQAKVIRQRPLPGLAHAFVFWGFCAFALVTINHFAEGFHVQLFSRDGSFGRIYFTLAAIFAVASVLRESTTYTWSAQLRCSRHLRIFRSSFLAGTRTDTGIFMSDL